MNPRAETPSLLKQAKALGSPLQRALLASPARVPTRNTQNERSSTFSMTIVRSYAVNVLSSCAQQTRAAIALVHHEGRNAAGLKPLAAMTKPGTQRVAGYAFPGFTQI
jgi:hypothetical protein